MSATKPPNRIPILYLFASGLSLGLLTKSEVIKWADKIIMEEDEPDILYINLSLSKTERELIDNLRGFDTPPGSSVQVRPLFALLYKALVNKKIDLKYVVNFLFQRQYEFVLTKIQTGYIYQFEHYYDCAFENVFGDLKDVQNDVEQFLAVYKDYTIDKVEAWPEMDKQTDLILENMPNKYKI